jgi:predicted NAD/FAD-binding protein
MATYKFPQFQVEITNPVVTADINTIGVQPDAMQISVSIKLETANALLYGVLLEQINVLDLTYESYDNLMLRVMTRLEDFIVV